MPTVVRKGRASSFPSSPASFLGSEEPGGRLSFVHLSPLLHALRVDLKGFFSQVVECPLLILGAVDSEFANGLFVAYISVWRTSEGLEGTQVCPALSVRKKK